MAQKSSARKTPTMTDAHKAALALGREEARQVKAYLEALENIAPKRRGRRRTKDSIGRRLVAIDKAMESSSALIKLQLMQERTDLEAELATLEAPPVDLSGLREKFIKVAKGYGERKGITYATWRAVGVDAATLKAAGISRS